MNYRDRKEAYEPPMAVQGDKGVAQVLDFSRDRKEAYDPPMATQGGKVVAQVPDFRRDRKEAIRQNCFLTAPRLHRHFNFHVLNIC